MKVVHITENPIAGAPLNLVGILNKYASAYVEARLISKTAANLGRTFGSDLLVNEHPEEIRQVIRDADIIHFHNFFKKQELFKRYPDLWPIVQKKKRVIQFHTQRQNKWISFEDALADKTMKHLVIAQYHPRQYPECTIVPNLIDIWDPKYIGYINENAIPYVVFAPGNISLNGWSDKGFEFTKDILRSLDLRGLIQKDIIMEVPHDECMKRKKVADIGIDEVITGSYHLNSLEYLSLGVVAVNACDDLTWGYMRSVCGAEKNPFYITRKPDLQSRLLDLVRQPKLLKELKVAGRVWMERYWDPTKLVHRYVDVYRSL